MKSCKKIISAILALVMAFCLSIQCFAVSYYDVDMDGLNKIYSFKNNEKVIDIAFSNPVILILLDRNGESILMTSEDVGETWSEVNLNKEYDGFKANGMFADSYVWSGVHIFGSKNGKLSILHSSTMLGWENVLCDVSKLDGEILNMVSSYLGYNIYAKIDGKLTLLTTKSLSYDLQMQDIDSIHENMFVNNNTYVDYTDKKVMLSSDGKNFIDIDLPQASKIEKCEIYDSDCSSTYITVVYRINSKTVKESLIEISQQNFIPTYKIKETRDCTDDYGFNHYGEWGLPLIVLKNNTLYRGMVKEDSDTSICNKSSIAWFYQIEAPDGWAYKDVAKMASTTILTPWTMPKNFSDPVTRELFCKYIYNFLAVNSGDSNMDFSTKFTDCSDKKINAISNLGIINGVGNNKFEPSRNITREEAITVIGRLVDYLKMNNDKTGIVKEFSDIKEVSDWAVSDVKKMQIMGIINGDNLGNFNPKSKLSVQESLSIIARIYNTLNPTTCYVCQ